MSETATAPEEQVETVRFGLQWPDGDPGELRAAAAAWREMAVALERTRARLEGEARRVAHDNRGQAIDSFAASWTRVDGDVSEMARTCGQLATALEDFADAVDEVREQILQLAAEIAASVAVGVTLAFFTAGLSASAIAATTARCVAVAARLGVTLGLRAATIMARVTVVGGFAAVEGMAVNVGVQLGSNAAFNDNHDPLDGFDVDEVLTSGAFSVALGGPVAAVASARHLARLSNAGRGALGEDVMDAAIVQQGGLVRGQQVTVRTASTRVRPDRLVHEADGTLAWADSKVVERGRTATLTPNQRVGFPELETVGGVPVGRNAAAAGLTPGQPVWPMPVRIYVWKW